MKSENEEVLFVDVELKYLPLEIYKYFLFTKYLEKKYKKVNYVALCLSDFLAFIKPKPLSKSQIERHLYAKKNSHAYKLNFYWAVVISPLIFASLIVKNWRFFWPLSSNRSFHNGLSKFTGLNKTPIGDCLASYILKLPGSRGFMHQSVFVRKAIFRALIYYSIFGAFIYTLRNVKAKKLFYCVETSYIDEAYRRLLISYQFNELTYDSTVQKTVEISPVLGYQKRLMRAERIDARNNAFDEKLACEKISNLVYRREKYSYMLASDVSNLADSTFTIGEIKGKFAIIYLHAVSDAQFFYGPDCFYDLHDWLIKSISLLEDENINVLIKIHPNFFSIQHPYPVDAEYLEYLQDLFEFKISDIDKSIPLKVKGKNIYFIHHSIPVITLLKVLPNHLCVTHHGTIATEAAFLGIASVVSSASPYLSDLDHFTMIYSGLDEYRDCIKSWADGVWKSSFIDMHSLYRFINYYQLTNAGLYLEGDIGEYYGIDPLVPNYSSYVEEFLSKNFAYDDSVEIFYPIFKKYFD